MSSDNELFVFQKSSSSLRAQLRDRPLICFCELSVLSQSHNWCQSHSSELGLQVIEHILIFELILFVGAVLQDPGYQERHHLAVGLELVVQLHDGAAVEVHVLAVDVAEVDGCSSAFEAFHEKGSSLGICVMRLLTESPEGINPSVVSCSLTIPGRYIFIYR